MIKIWLAGALAVVLVVAGIAYYAELFWPRNYESCVLHNIHGVTNESIIGVIVRTCRDKFDKSKKAGMELLPMAVDKLAGRAGVVGARLSGMLYNGNADYAVTQVVVRLTPKDRVRPDAAEARDYAINVAIDPLSTKEFSVPVDPGDGKEVAWTIVGAKGYRVES
jgi:hypothetical protein